MPQIIIYVVLLLETNLSFLRKEKFVKFKEENLGLKERF